MLPITRRISAYNHSAVNDIRYIVCHDTGNVTDSDEGNANFFNTGNRGASAHLFVDDDSITQVVEFNEGSWHCGDGGGAYGITNHNSIGIEMCRVNNNVTAKTEQNTLELVKFLMNKFNIPLERVVRHYDASRKPCPKSFSANNWARWTAFKAKLAGQPTPAPTPEPSNDPYIGYGVVTASTLNVRDEASTSSPILGTLKSGDRVKIGSKQGDWYNIFYGSHGGYVSAKYINFNEPKPVPTPTPKPTPAPVASNVFRVRKSWEDVKSQIGAFSEIENAKECVDDNAGYKVFDKDGKQVYPQANIIGYGEVTADVLNVREGRGTNFTVIGQLKSGDKVKLCYLLNNWYSIDFGTKIGYVYADYIKKL